MGFYPLRIVCISAALIPAAAAGAEAAESAWDTWESGALRLVGAAESHNGDYAAGLEFELAEGWKVYWRAPGDAGFPPRVDWSESQNLKKGALRWPAPERFSVLGLETLGYKNRVILPLYVTAHDPAQDIVLRGAAEYLACDEICVPVKAQLRMTVPAESGARAGRASPHAQVIAKYDARVPDEGTAAGIKIKSVRVDAYESGADASVLRVSGHADPPLSSAADVFFDGPPGLAYGRPEALAVSAAAAPGAFELAAEVTGLKYLETPFIGAPLTALAVDGERAAEAVFTVALTPAGAAAAPADGGAPLTLWAVLMLAVLGGMILNLMPCVLPVLSLKLMSVITHGGASPARVRGHFLASAAGVMTLFALLAAALSGLKTAGAAVGWGVQFQQPWFLAAMAVVTIIFAANLFGFFEIRLPAFARNGLNPPFLQNAGARADSAHGRIGAFFTGMFAAVLATPCSAPFVGTAAGFALSRGPAEITAVMLALGLGLAAPYLAVAAAPAAVTLLPKPGPWMVKLRIALGFALAGTAAWLIWVLAGVIGPAQFEPRAQWAAFSRAALAEHTAAGRVVFVDVTADWCVTCKANKTLVLNRGAAAGALAADDVTLLQADWTRPDAEIADYLASFRRYGIPFNAVYGPGAPEGEVLPELLTTDAVLGAVARARGG